MQARQATYTPENIRSAFAACGIVPFNKRRVLGDASRFITRPSSKSTTHEVGILATPKESRKAATLRRQALNLCSRSTPRSQLLRAIVDKMGKGLEEAIVNAKLQEYLVSEVRAETLGEGYETTKDMRRIGKTRVLTSEDRDRLLEQKEAEAREKEAKVNAKKNRKIPVEKLSGAGPASKKHGGRKVRVAEDAFVHEFQGWEGSEVEKSVGEESNISENSDFEDEGDWEVACIGSLDSPAPKGRSRGSQGASSPPPPVRRSGRSSKGVKR